MAPMNSIKRRGPDVSASSKERNEYIPSFIAKKPFYVAENSIESDYLEHQRLQKSSSDDSQRWYERGKKIGPAATKFRKGACENCGALTHKTKECLSRPRKQGARWTGKDISADEVIQDLSLGWDAKRDRWNGYDPQNYKDVVDEFHVLEDLRRNVKDGETGAIRNLIIDHVKEEDDGVKYEEETDMGRQQSTSTRNLRIREDTAKYLLNLDLDSAKYDPKTRSMVDSGATADQTAALVAEEGFLRTSGDAAEFEKAQRYAWEMQERGDKNRIHLQANPTSGEYFRRREEIDRTAMKKRKHESLVEKYGGQKYLQNEPNDSIIESEQYIEYDNRGAIKVLSVMKHKSSYPEDVLINNHRAVWGSWWNDSQWGYACCHSIIKNSYCTGNEGRAVLAEGSLPIQEKTNDLKTVSSPEDSERGEHVSSHERNGSASRQHKQYGKRNLEAMKTEAEEAEAELEALKRKRVCAVNPGSDPVGRYKLVH